MSTESNKRLAKNTIALYFRTFVTLLVALYTSRVVLNILGVTDYGIYNVVGSIVVMFSFLSNALAYATERFLTIELGRYNIQEQKRVFSMSMTSIFSIALIIVFFAETIGLWFLNNKLSIPTDRMFAAKCTYQISILTFCINIVRTPYYATIISHEKMSFFAYISIVEALLKLGIVFLLQAGDFDKLILYSVLLVVITELVNIVYQVYCNRKFEICKYNFFWDKKLYTELMSFSGWSLIGSGTNVATQNGLVFMINIFWGVAVNASLGIANQVNAAVTNFVAGFQTSFVPQIVKTYAQNEKEKLSNLINKTSKFSFMLMFIPVFALMLNMQFVLKIWLHNVPNYTVELCIWMLACTIVDATTGPYYAAIMATGKIKRYQISISISFALDLICTFTLIRLGVTPQWLFVSRFLTRGILNMLIGLNYLKIQLEFDLVRYFKKVLFPIICSILLIIPIPLFIMECTSDWHRLVYSLISIIGIAGPVFYKVLLTGNEQTYLLDTSKKIFFKNKYV
jgi:Membrane protein involved in the export of O-antigen and teichoic acid